MKDFVLNFGRKIIDFGTWFSVILALLIFIICLFITLSYPAPVMFLLMFLLPLLILVITLISNYFIYLLIDIRDSIKEINNKLLK